MAPASVWPVETPGPTGTNGIRICLRRDAGRRRFGFFKSSLHVGNPAGVSMPGRSRAIRRDRG